MFVSLQKDPLHLHISLQDLPQAPASPHPTLSFGCSHASPPLLTPALLIRLVAYRASFSLCLESIPLASARVCLLVTKVVHSPGRIPAAFLSCLLRCCRAPTSLGHSAFVLLRPSICLDYMVDLLLFFVLFIPIVLVSPTEQRPCCLIYYDVPGAWHLIRTYCSNAQWRTREMVEMQAGPGCTRISLLMGCCRLRVPSLPCSEEWG